MLDPGFMIEEVVFRRNYVLKPLEKVAFLFSESRAKTQPMHTQRLASRHARYFVEYLCEIPMAGRPILSLPAAQESPLNTTR